MGKSSILEQLEQMALGHLESFPKGSQPPIADDVAVIKLDMKNIDFLKDYDNKEDWSTQFKAWLVRQARKQHNISIAKDEEHPLLLWVGQLVRDKKRVIILIDEYDSVPVDMALDKNFGIGKSKEFVLAVLKPFFQATKQTPGIIKVVVFGVSNLALNTIGSGANHFVNVFQGGPTYAGLVGFSPQEIKETYGELVLKRFRLTLPKKERPNADLDQAIDHLKRFGNGWCLEPTSSVQAFSPFVVNSWLHPDRGMAPLAGIWTDTGKATALVNLLKSHAPQLLETRCIKYDRLYKQTEFEDYFSESNIDQLAFQFGYLSVEHGSFNTKDATVVLGPPNEGVVLDVQECITKAQILNSDVALQIKGALQACDWNKLQLAITDLSKEFQSKMNRPFDNEAELHTWGTTWVAAINNVGNGFPLFVAQELRVRLEGESTDKRVRPRLDSLVYWETSTNTRRGVLIEWGVDAGISDAKLEAFADVKLEQIKGKRYVERAQKFQRENNMPIDDLVAVAVVLGKDHACVVKLLGGVNPVCLTE
jgi:hypothetical protein